MAQAGSIKAISGSVSAQTSTGQVRELNIGDIIYENELILTSDGAKITIELDNGKTINLSENAQIFIDESVIGVVDAHDAVVSEVESLQAALEAGEDITDAEDATALGNEDDSYDYDLAYYAGDQTRGEVGTLQLPTEYTLPEEIASEETGNIEEVVPTPAIPEANPDYDQTTEGVEGDSLAMEGNVLENDLSGDGPMTVTAVGGSAANVGVPITTDLGGTLTINADGSYSYIPPAETDHSQGEVHDITTYTITNTEGNSASSTLDINVLDTAPIAVPDNHTVEEGGIEVNNQVSGNVLTNDVESADTGMTVTNPGTYTGTHGGTLELFADGSYTYTAPDNVNNAEGDPTDVFNYTIVDTDGSTSSSTLTITITDTGPTAYDDFTAALTEDDDVTTVSGSVLDNDDSGADIPAAFVSWDGTGLAATELGTYGTLDLNADGTYSFVLDNDLPKVQALDAGDVETFTFDYTMADDDGDQDDATLTIKINGTNDVPELTSESGAGVVQEDVTISDSGTLTATDVDNNAVLTWDLASGEDGQGTYGEFGIDSDGNWTYDLANGTNGVAGVVQSLAEGEQHSETFNVMVSDEHGASVPQTVEVTITGTNDAPDITWEVAADTAGSVTEAGNLDDGTVVPGTLTASGDLDSTDIDHNATATWSIATDANATDYGSMVIDQDGTWTYTLDDSAAVE